ncbi:MAG: peptidoglycan bridge formation glycyltransferase FemA/FemB family protein [Salinigranum sp.]
MSLEVDYLASIEEANRNQWNNVVEQSDLGCVSHRYGWLRAIELGTDDEPRHLVVSKKGNPIAVFPNFVTDLGPVDQLCSIKPGFGGPIAMTDEEASIDLLLDAVSDLCDGRILFNALRTYDQNYVRYHSLLRERGYGMAVLSCRFSLDLSGGWDDVFEGMHSERRRGIRRGHDNDFDVVDEAVTERTLSSFYDEYARVMDRVEMPTLPRSFVLELASFSDRVKLFSLDVDGERRGSYLYLLDDEQSTLQHLFTAVTEEQFRYHAPELLHEHAIRWGIENGYDSYDLRGAHPDFRDGVFRFKEYFGAQTKPLLVWERGRPGPALSVLNAGRTVYRRLTA